MALNRNTPPLKLRSRRHTEKYKISEFDFKNDLRSQQTTPTSTVELQITHAYAKIQHFLKSTFDFQNDFRSQQATVEFQLRKAHRKK